MFLKERTEINTTCLPLPWDGLLHFDVITDLCQKKRKTDLELSKRLSN